MKTMRGVIRFYAETHIWTKALMLTLSMMIALVLLYVTGGRIASADDLSGMTNYGSHSTDTGNSTGLSNGGSGVDSTTSPEDLGKSAGDMVNQLPQKKDDTGFSDMMNNFHPVNKESTQAAQEKLTPVLGILSFIISALIVIAFILTFLISALDIIYIAIPFTRDFLDGGQMAGGASIGMGNGLAMGGMAMGGMATAQSSNAQSRKWVSDEAVSAVQEAAATSSGAQVGAMAGGMMGRGMMGSGMMGGLNPQSQGKSKSAMGIYMTKRVKFYVWFGIATILLFTNFFFGLGVKIAAIILGVGGNIFGL